jgi:hypothetical protein
MFQFTRVDLFDSKSSNCFGTQLKAYRILIETFVSVYDFPLPC